MDNNTPSVAQEVAEKTAKLEKWAAKVAEAQQVMIEAAQRGDFESFSEEEVRFHLSHDPDMIAEAGLYLAEIQRHYEYAKLNVKSVWAELWHECNVEREALGLSNAKDREAWVVNQPRYQRAVQQEIEWKSQQSRMQVVYDRYENLFTGSRKIANLIEKDVNNQYRVEKYGQ